MLKKRWAALAAAGAILTGASVGYALWSTTGTGTGRATSLTAQAVTAVGSTGVADLYPGFTDGELYLQITNPNPYPVTITQVTPSGVTSSDPTGCPSSNVTADSLSGLSFAVPANGSASHVVPDVVNMASSAPNGCQTVTFTIDVTVTGTQA